MATLASYEDALALDPLKERPLLWLVDVPEAEIVLVDAHLSALHEWPTKLRKRTPIEKIGLANTSSVGPTVTQETSQWSRSSPRLSAYGVN